MRLCVFCASSAGTRPDYLQAARDVGRRLAERGVGVVYGGASVGMMGALADAALAAGGEVHGVIPTQLESRELAHRGLTSLHVVDSMHARKAKMAALSDGFLALPGGIGTLEELFEVWTWGKLGIHAKPCGLLDVAGYYRPLWAALEHMAREGLVRALDLSMLTLETDVDRLLEAFRRYSPPAPLWSERVPVKP